MPSGSAQIEVAVARHRSDIERLVPAWRRLAAERGGVFGLPDVAIPWWDHLGRGTLHVVAAHRDGQLLAVAPLHERRWAGRSVLRWLGHGLGVVGEIVAEPGETDGAEQIWRSLASSRSVLELTAFRQGGAGLPELRREAGLDTRLVVSGLCPIVELESTSSVSDWFADRPGLAKSLRRLERALDTSGVNFETEVITSAERVRAVLPQLRATSRAAELVLPRLDLFAPPWQTFTESMLDATALAGHLVLVTGRFDGELVAFDIVLRSGPTMYDIYGRYDPALARYSPGTLVQREVLRAAIDVGAHRLDLQLGDHPYKRRWADGAYDAIDVLAAPIGGLRRAAAWQQVILGAHSGRAALRARTTASRAGRPAATGER